MRYCLFMTLLIIFPILHAEHSKPEAIKPCKPIVVNKDPVVLSSDKPVIIMVHNPSANALWITHSSSPHSSTSFSSLLDPGRWSALRLNGKDGAFELNCVESRPGHEQQVPCIGLISLCQSALAKVDKTMETALLGENMELTALKEQLLVP